MAGNEVGKYLGIPLAEQDPTFLQISSLLGDLKDYHPETFTHSLGTMKIVTGYLQSKFIKDPEVVRAYQYGALLHDIGKRRIPVSFLDKKEELTEAEWGVFTDHPEIGINLVRANFGNDLPQLTYDIIRYHQEKWDGSGYPEGLEGENIPYAARVFALADAIDAMVHGRVYRKPMSLLEIIREINLNKEKYFDPVIAGDFSFMFGLIRLKDYLPYYPWRGRVKR